jgi:hypothetical protein
METWRPEGATRFLVDDFLVVGVYPENGQRVKPVIVGVSASCPEGVEGQSGPDGRDLTGDVPSGVTELGFEVADNAACDGEGLTSARLVRNAGQTMSASAVRRSGGEQGHCVVD